MDNHRRRFKDRVVTKVITISFVSVLLTFAFLVLLTFFAFEFGDWEIHIPPELSPRSPLVTMGILIFVSLVFGLFFSAFISTRFLQPVNELKKMTSKVAKGDFTVQMVDIPENEFGEFIEDFNTMVKELRKNEMLKNAFVSNVSHEFKTHLSVIEGYASLLQDPSLTEEDRQKYTQIIIESTKKLSTLVNNVLKISKLDNRKITINKEEYYLDEQIRESILSYQDEWANKRIDFEIDMETILINADKNLLVNVWNNLISNAIKFSPENSTIFITLSEENEHAKISIKDEGCGIPKDDIPYIFDKFFQVDKSHKSNGNGLGLTLVKDIIDLVKGEIKVESEVNKGTTFTIYLPIR